MEIYIPNDMKKKVEQVRQISDDYLNKFKSTIDDLLPAGYTFKVTGGRSAAILKTPDNIEDLRWSYRCTELVSTFGGDLHIDGAATPDDIYKLNGMLQLLAGVNTLLISDITVSK